MKGFDARKNETFKLCYVEKLCETTFTKTGSNKWEKCIGYAEKIEKMWGLVEVMESWFICY